MPSTLDYATPKPTGFRMGAGLWLTIVAGALTVPSFIVVFLNAADEPYFGAVKTSDWLIQVGAGTALLVAWALLSAVAGWLAYRARCTPWVLALVPWGLICCFYLASSVQGFLNDVATFKSGNYPGGPNYRVSGVSGV